MSQYYVLANHDIEEYVEPSELGNPTAMGMLSDGHAMRLFQFLITDAGSIGPNDFDSEGSPYHGRWATDRVAAVGDANEMFADVPLEVDGHPVGYTNITSDVVAAFNSAVHDPDLKVVPDPIRS